MQIGFDALNRILVADNRLFWRLRPALPPTRIVGSIGPLDRLDFSVSTGPQGWRIVPPVAEPTRTIVCLGDSCTFGVGVDDDRTFAAVLQTLLPDVRCINAGVPGYSAFQGRRVLADNLSAWRPAAVTISFGWNDASPWDGLGDAEHPNRMHESMFDQLGLVRVMRRGVGSLLGSRRPKPTEDLRPRLTPREFDEQLAGIIADCGRAGAMPVLLRWPTRRQVAMNQPAGAYDLVVADRAKAGGVPMIDLGPLFAANGGRDLYVDVIHASVRGHWVVAEALAVVFADLKRSTGPTSQLSH